MSKNKLRVEMDLDSDFIDTYDALGNYFFNALPPESQVKDSYSMSSHYFGRCWNDNTHSFKLDLWFPSETYSNEHLTALLAEFFKILDLPMNASVDDTTPSYSIAELKPKVYFMAMQDSPATYTQITRCCDIFLDSTRKVAESLGIEIKDEVRYSGGNSTASKIRGLAFFSSGTASSSTGPSTGSYQWGHKA